MKNMIILLCNVYLSVAPLPNHQRIQNICQKSVSVWLDLSRHFLSNLHFSLTA